MNLSYYQMVSKLRFMLLQSGLKVKFKLSLQHFLMNYVGESVHRATLDRRRGREIISYKANKFRSVVALLVMGWMSPQIKSRWLIRTNKVFDSNWTNVVFHYGFDDVRSCLHTGHGIRIMYGIEAVVCIGGAFMFTLMLSEWGSVENKQFFHLPPHKFSHAWRTFRSSNIAFCFGRREKKGCNVLFFVKSLKLSWKQPM